MFDDQTSRQTTTSLPLQTQRSRRETSHRRFRAFLRFSAPESPPVAARFTAFVAAVAPPAPANGAATFESERPSGAEEVRRSLPVPVVFSFSSVVEEFDGETPFEEDNGFPRGNGVEDIEEKVVVGGAVEDEDEEDGVLVNSTGRV